jgi:predicted permease
MQTLMQDIRYGIRILWKAPGFTAVAALTLALGIGANTGIFSLVNGILLAPLPFSSPEQLVSVRGTYPKGAFVALRKQVRTMDVASYAEGHEFNLTGNGEPIRLAGTMVSAELFSVLGARPEFGRIFYPEEDTGGQDNFVILSHALWEQRFGRDATIVGRSIELEGVSRQIVGVMPANFRFPSPKTQIWVPLHNDPRLHAYWADDFMPVVGRLRPGATIQQAQNEIRMFQSHVFELFPWPMPHDWNADISVVPLQNGMVADVRTRLLLLLGAVALILLIACANVANLMLSRSATREKEIGIRSALGAGRHRIIRQLLTESVVLASLGGSLGLVFASAGLSVLKATLPADTPRLADVHTDWRVLAFSAALSFLTGIIFGLAPALQASRTSLTESLKAGGRGAAISVSHRLRGALAVGEVAFAMLLVVAAGLLIRSFWALSHVNPGFQSERVVTARITPNQSFCNDPGRCLAFYRVLLDKLQHSPGVKSAALVNDLPLEGGITKRAVYLEDYTPSIAGLLPLLWLQIVTPDYFRVMNISVLAGRAFTPSDESGTPPVAILTGSTAQKYWPGQNPIGRHIRFAREDEWRTVVGIIADVRAYDLQRNVPDWMKGAVYVPYSPKATLEDERIPAEMTLVLQTAADDAQIGTMLRGLVNALNPEVPVTHVKTMRAVVSAAVATPASTASLFVTFSGLALALGMVGIYGVLAFLVSKRTREIGIRVALGAQRRDVLWLVLKEGARFGAIGIALGLVSAFAVTRWISSELYGVSAADPLTFASVSCVMATVTMLACYIPARRAMAIDPLIALRFD